MESKLLRTDHNGDLITDINEIYKLALDKRCVIYRGQRTPAAFVISMQAWFLINEINRKVIYHYKKVNNVRTSTTGPTTD